MTDTLYEGSPVHPNETSPRLAPQPVEEMRQDWLEILSRIPGAGLKGEGFPRNVLGVLMYNPETFGPFLDYWVTCKLKMGLTVREQELVILRMGCLYRSNYVWRHHVPVGREFGVTDAELDGLRLAEYIQFSEREQSILHLTDELVNNRTVSAEAWHRYNARLKDSDLVDLIHLVSQYVLFALMNNAMQVQVEPALLSITGIVKLEML
ncbi:MAG: carboxymuconolactone decarboxylase family protein [Chloroflexota bacterium]